MRRDYIVALDDDAFKRLDAARKRFAAKSMDDFILLALAIAERTSTLVQPSGAIHVVDGHPDDPDAPFIAVQVREPARVPEVAAAD